MTSLELALIDELKQRAGALKLHGLLPHWDELTDIEPA